MDTELIAYLDERFRETSQQIRELREETSQEIQGFREETSQRFDTVDKRLEQMDEQLRLTGVRVESLEGKVQVVAEGVTGVDEKLKDFRETVHLEFRDSRVQTSLFLKTMSERVRALELRAGRPEI
jgi:predicted nuclease with TOPRIM domain